MANFKNRLFPPVPILFSILHSVFIAKIAKIASPFLENESSFRNLTAYKSDFKWRINRVLIHILPQFVLLKLLCNRCKLKLGYVTNNFFLLAATSFAKESLIKYAVVRMRLKRRSKTFTENWDSKHHLLELSWPI